MRWWKWFRRARPRRVVSYRDLPKCLGKSGGVERHAVVGDRIGADRDIGERPEVSALIRQPARPAPVVSHR